MYCPSCGQASLTRSDAKAFRCEHCQFTYFHNTASAVLAVICCGDEVLVAERGRNPSKGMLDFPGGFVDYDESLEQALYRELQEELAFSLAILTISARHPTPTFTVVSSTKPVMPFFISHWIASQKCKQMMMLPLSAG